MRTRRKACSVGVYAPKPKQRCMNVTLRLAAALAAASLVNFPAIAPAADLPHVPAGFTVAVIAHIEHARELAATPDGALFVGTSGSNVYVVADAEDRPAKPRIFTTVPDREAAGVAVGAGFLFIGSTHGVWSVPLKTGDLSAQTPPVKIASVRTMGDGGHSTTSVAVAGNTLFASIGSSCNACEERDPTRATIQQMSAGGRDMHAKAIHIRNAIALAVDPAGGALWAGVAGQDELEHGHPYEIFDDVSAHAGTADYGWPHCYENRRPVEAGHDCAAVTVARVYLPAYETPIGAAFYPLHSAGAHAFPQAYRGGAFVALHGSWHEPPVPPRVAFVPLRGDEPLTPVDWSDPGKQWTPFLDGFQAPGGERSGRPTGVAVGADGSLFVADDLAGVIYRIRPKN
jgi:glucose/arabinose dehydrogenase